MAAGIADELAIEIGEAAEASLAAEAAVAGDAAAFEGAAISVEESAAVEEAANAPKLSENATKEDIASCVSKEPGATIWAGAKAFTKFVASNVASAGIMFGIMYGLNKATAQKAHETGTRQSLTDYLDQCKSVFEGRKHPIKWTDEMEELAAKDALGFAWIDCTK